MFFKKVYMDGGLSLVDHDDWRDAMASTLSVPAHTLDRHMAANHLWQHGGASGRYAVPGQINLGGNTIYQVTCEAWGLYNVPGAGVNRVMRYVGPANKKPGISVVHFPGFAHTHRYEDAQWYVRLLAELSQQYNAAFVTLNTGGRAVKGYDVAPGAGGYLTLDEQMLDNDCVVHKILHELSVGRRDLQVILSGHSLGGRLAREQACKMHEDPYGYKGWLKAVTLQASVGCKTWEDFTTLRYLAAVAPKTLQALNAAFNPFALGVDLDLGDVAKLFYSGWGHEYIAKIAAHGLVRGGAREFLANTLGAGDSGRFYEVAQHLGRGGVQVIRPDHDNIFNRGKTDSLPRASGGEFLRIPGPHCYLLPDADQNIRDAVRRGLEEILLHCHT